MDKFDFNWEASKEKPKKCRNCGKTKELHKAGTLECPAGMKTRIGYISFGPTKYEEVA